MSIFIKYVLAAMCFPNLSTPNIFYKHANGKVRICSPIFGRNNAIVTPKIAKLSQKCLFLPNVLAAMCFPNLSTPNIFTSTQMAKLEFVHQFSVEIMLLFRHKSQTYRKNVYIYQMFWPLCASQIFPRPIFSIHTQMAKLEFVH